MKLITRTNGREEMNEIKVQKQVLSINELLQVRGGGDAGGLVTKAPN